MKGMRGMDVKKDLKLCMICMQEHQIEIVIERTKNIFKNEEIKYDEKMFYCPNAEEYSIPEDFIKENDKNMKDAYRKKVGLLESEDIKNIRETYRMSQKDMARILGWSESTITRYETHQVQDNAHDSILRKISNDPRWLFEFLEDNKSQISDKAYLKYRKEISKQLRLKENEYITQSLEVAHISENKEKYNGNSLFNLDKVIDTINYIANKMSPIYLVKLMKTLWYIDNLSYKLRNKSLTGMVYYKLPMGAAPHRYQLITELKDLTFEKVDFGESQGVKLISNPKYKYKDLTEEDKEIIDRVISELISLSTNGCIEKMHREQAYIKTKNNKRISYDYANQIDLD